MWTETDRAKATLYRAWKNQECPNCHTRPQDWETDPDFRVADIGHCEGCARLEEMREQLQNPAKGTYIGLYHKAVVEARLDAEEE